MARDMSWNMSKRQALKNVAICLGLAVLFFIIQLSGCGTFFLLLAIWPALIWCVKFARDQKIIADAKAAQARQPEQLTMPPMTSKGSNQLFVPPPLDRQ